MQINKKLSTVGKSWDELNKEFNPNNKARIELPRQETFIKQLIASTVYAYNTVMSDYTKNTGGGDSDDAAIVVWKELDEVEIVNYDIKIKNSVYLTIVRKCK